MVTDPTDSDDDGENVSLSPATEQQLREALVSAYRPLALKHDVNEALIEKALDNPLRPATQDELVESERFRQALAGAGDHPDQALAEALKQSQGSVSAHARAEEASSRALLQALSRAGPGKRRPNLIFVTFGVATSLAAVAAAVLLLVGALGPKFSAEQAQPAAASLVPNFAQSRSSGSLFSGRFERQRTTERVDTIASVRARELRSNRFKQWGVAE